MLYYYAHSGHKVGLDRVKRAVALLKALNDQGIENRLLVNDFRAGLAARELGLKDYVTIEGVMDIDAIADTGDSIIMDTPENDNGRIEKYCSDFAHVFRFANGEDDTTRATETLIKPMCRDEHGLEALIIDAMYTNDEPKVQRTLFFLSDADYDKEILGNAAFFEGEGMELLLGNYFFVKYEEELSRLFDKVYEAEEYVDLLKTSSHIVTASGQTALEAYACGAKVVYIKTDREEIVPLDIMTRLGIPVLQGFDKTAYRSICFEKSAATIDQYYNHSAIIPIIKILKK